MSEWRVDVAFETILIEIYRIVTRKSLETGGDAPKAGGESTKIVLDKAGSKKNMAVRPRPQPHAPPGTFLFPLLRARPLIPSPVLPAQPALARRRAPELDLSKQQFHCEECGICRVGCAICAGASAGAAACSARNAVSICARSGRRESRSSAR